MRSFDQRFAVDRQWQTYKQLELLPDSAPSPRSAVPAVIAGWFWQKLLDLLMDELVEEQQIEYLDRCWQLTVTEQSDQQASTLKRLWTLMN